MDISHRQERSTDPRGQTLRMDDLFIFLAASRELSPATV